MYKDSRHWRPWSILMLAILAVMGILYGKNMEYGKGPWICYELCNHKCFERGTYVISSDEDSVL